MIRSSGKRWTDYDKRLLAQLAGQGLTSEAIALRMGRSFQAIENQRGRQGAWRRDFADLPRRQETHGNSPIMNIAMHVTPWRELGGGVRQRFVCRQDDLHLVD